MLTCFYTINYIIHLYSALYHKLSTQSSAPEDGRNHPPKHVELIGIINKSFLLHLVGCLYYCISDARSYKHKNYINMFNHTLSFFTNMFRSLMLPSSGCVITRIQS